MPDPSTLLLFSGAALALIVIPGPAVLYILAQSVEHGRRAGVLSALGVATGGLVHIVAAAVGISALVVSSAVAFSAVKYAGAGYLLYLGIRRLLDRAPREERVARAARPGLIFRRGVIVNVLNPKTALFFLAFLPQFVDPDHGPVLGQILVLGTTFVLLALLSDSLYALGAGAIAARIRRRSRRAQDAGRYAGAAVYLGLGTATALASRHQ
ncbi:MAG TPA: LysE family translocator [Solirubrobacteraceae bacterium]|nr:LysE family translocator [Solirubrobacteraceae bacterium]